MWATGEAVHGDDHRRADPVLHRSRPAGTCAPKTWAQARATAAALNTPVRHLGLGGSDRNAYARATYSDSMALQGPDNRFQLFNFQLSGSFEFDNRRSLTGDFTWQQTWQEEAARFDGFARLGNARNDSRARAAKSSTATSACGAPRLRFESRLKLAQDVLNQPGTLLSIPDRETKL